MSPVHLPQQPTAFIGRDPELNEIATLLDDPTCRLLTFVGPGGIGKTTLAIQAATNQESRFADGVSFVALAPVVSPDFLLAAMGAALEIPFFGSEEPLTQIKNYLHDKHILLVMDNFEHLLEGVGCLSDLLQAATRLKILVTSRERLNLREEWIFLVSGLPYPAAPFADAPENYSAVQLFVQRSRQIQHQFSLDDNLQAVRSICRQVEGMPLGLELAAGWLRVMSCQQIAARMASNFDFLTTPLRNVPERHRSLRVVFQQSWSLLPADEQAVLMRLSIFHGGFDFDAAAEVAGAELPVLASLADKSMLRMDSTGRYDLHQLLRQYAGEKLSENNQTHATAQRHLVYFMKLTEAGEAHVYGREQVMWYDRLEVEMDNLRAALTWALNHDEAEKGLRIAGALRWVWEMRGYLGEGVSWLTKLLVMRSDVSPLVRSNALHCAGELAGQLAYEPQATLWAQEALSLARLINDRWSLAWALSTAAYFTEPHTDHAAAMLEESLMLFRELNDSLGLSHTFRRLAGCAIDQHNYTYAANLLEQALVGDRLAGDKNATAWDLCFMGVTLWSQYHQPEQVIPLYQESVALFREIKDVRGSAHPLEMLAEVERSQGHFAKSQALFQETLRLEQELGIRDNLAIYALAGIASIAVAQGKLDWSAQLLGAVNEALESGSYNTRIATLVDIFDTTVAALHTQLDDEAFNAAWAVGKSMSLDQAIKDALQDVPLEDDLSYEETNQSLVEPISPREFDVLHLLGDGFSNAEIAQKLFISVATVKVHTRSIYGKLNVNNRTQAILQAQKLNLL